MKPECGGGLLLLRHVTPLARRYVVYFCSGAHTPALAREFFNDVIAPAKRMELIPDTGHFAAFQQPEHFLGLLLTHVRCMADVPTRELLNQSRCKNVDECNVIRPESL